MAILVCYPTKLKLAQSVGQPLNYHASVTTSANPYTDNGTFPVVYRPTLWPHEKGSGREFKAMVTMHEGKISRVV